MAPPTLLTLPAEIRLKIYSYLVPTALLKEDTQCLEYTALALLYVCPQVAAWRLSGLAAEMEMLELL